jgi:hypothetical protein
MPLFILDLQPINLQISRFSPIFVIGIRCEKGFVYHHLLASLTPIPFLIGIQASQRNPALRGLLFYKE